MRSLDACFIILRVFILLIQVFEECEKPLLQWKVNFLLHTYPFDEIPKTAGGIGVSIILPEGNTPQFILQKSP